MKIMQSRFCICLAAYLAAVSCLQQISAEHTGTQIGDLVSIHATIETPADASRTGLKDETHVVWSAGDAVALFTAVTKDRFELASGANTGSATFAGTTSGTAPYYAFYPYSDDCSVIGGSLAFKLPSEQKYVAGSFAPGVSPALATMANLTDDAGFRNLCGILQLNLCGTGKIKRVEIVDLAGNMLWGDCLLSLDGKQGSSEQSLSVTGGSNRLVMVMEKEVTLLRSTPRVLNFIVPPGSLSGGFSVKVFDAAGKALSFMTAQNPELAARRSVIIPMEKTELPENGEPKDTLARGHHSDIFMDAGLYLTTRNIFPPAPFLGWGMDFLATAEDSLLQWNAMVESEQDENGCLLYPDNMPRYRMVYCNGGRAGNHGRSLTSKGRSHYKTFVANGGSYVGSCAGCFFACEGNNVGVHNEYYLGIYPGPVFQTGLMDSRVGMTIPENSVLLDYYDYGGDFRVDSIYQNGGGYVTVENLVPGAEILALYDRPDMPMHGNGSIWAYKADEKTGRVVTTGSHPEYGGSGEKRELMTAMVRYATEGNGVPRVKAELENGVSRNMDKCYSDHNPAFARIGDGQYHHFTIEIPENAKDIKIELTGDNDATLHLSLRRGTFAWLSDADYLIVRKGSSKTLEIPSLEAGKWYVGVYCAEKVVVACDKEKFDISGSVEALNGIPYTLSVSWK